MGFRASTQPTVVFELNYQTHVIVAIIQQNIRKQMCIVKSLFGRRECRYPTRNPDMRL